MSESETSSVLKDSFLSKISSYIVELSRGSSLLVLPENGGAPELNWFCLEKEENDDQLSFQLAWFSLADDAKHMDVRSLDLCDVADVVPGRKARALLEKVNSSEIDDSELETGSESDDQVYYSMSLQLRDGSCLMLVAPTWQTFKIWFFGISFLTSALDLAQQDPGSSAMDSSLNTSGALRESVDTTTTQETSSDDLSTMEQLQERVSVQEKVIETLLKRLNEADLKNQVASRDVTKSEENSVLMGEEIKLLRGQRVYLHRLVRIKDTTIQVLRDLLGRLLDEQLTDDSQLRDSMDTTTSGDSIQ